MSALHKRLNGGGGGGGGGQQGGGGGQHHNQPSAHDQQEQLARIVQQKRENCALVAQQVLTKTENYFLNCFFSIFFTAGAHEIAVVNFLLNVRPSTAKTKFAGKCCKNFLRSFLFRRWTSLCMRVLLPVMRTTSMDSQNKFQGFRGLILTIRNQ